MSHVTSRLSHVMCHTSCVTCHMSPVTPVPIIGHHSSTDMLVIRPVLANEEKKVMCFVSHVKCHMPPVTCHLSCVLCHMSHVTFAEHRCKTQTFYCNVIYCTTHLDYHAEPHTLRYGLGCNDDRKYLF